MAVTELKLIKCHGAARLVAEVNKSIGEGYQPNGKLIEFEDGDLGFIMFQGTPDGGGGGGSITPEDIGAATQADFEALEQRVVALETEPEV